MIESRAGADRECRSGRQWAGHLEADGQQQEVLQRGGRTGGTSRLTERAGLATVQTFILAGVQGSTGRSCGTSHKEPSTQQPQHHKAPQGGGPSVAASGSVGH